MYKLVFTRQADEETILREFHTLEEHLLKLKARTNVSRSGGIGIIDTQVPMTLEELQVEINQLGLAANVEIRE